ncbi:unnamed protein product [Durusdinium trenchii]|uniref:J domain-containing protein n=1 Tax=Durusdinium trenchii TaxID=1381693 RepID=A0ABP0INP6_9DINO
MRNSRLLVILLAKALAQKRFRSLQEVTATSSTSTATTTSDPCILAQTACDCADGGICGWSAFADGGGICHNRGRPTEIDCFLCERQQKCASTMCPQMDNACTCAAAAGCAWDMGFGQCVASTEATDCRACPSRAGCDLDPPVLFQNGFSPANGGSHSSGSDLRIVLQFNKVVTWCPGTVMDEVVPRTYMQFSTASLTIDMSWYLSQVALESESFQLLDEVGPTLVNFDPDSMSVPVPLDGSVNLLWSEPIILTLGERTVDNTGATTVVQSFSIPLKEPEAEIISSSLLRIYLNGLLRTWLETWGEGLPAQAFNFRAATAGTVPSTQVPTSSNAVGIVILVVCVTVFCILAGGIGLVKLCRSHADALHSFMPKMPKPKARNPSRAVEPSQTDTKAQFAAVAAAAENAAYRAAAAAERLRGDDDTKPATSASASWAQRPSKAPSANPKAGPKVHPERDGFNAGRARRSTAPTGESQGLTSYHLLQARDMGGNESNKAPPPESNLPPEVKAVEKKLHDLMDEPIATRRKLFKDGAARPRELKRLEKELQDIRALAKDGKEAQVSADSVENDLTHWKAWLKGWLATLAFARQLKQSKAFQAQVRVDELLKEYSEERDKKRAALDQAFTPDEVDFSASKAFDYDRSVNYYEVLGIDEYEPLDEVNRAYKRLSLVYHPDKTKGMSSQQQQDYETIFISVKNAHLVLGDQATRRQYDKDRDHDRAKELVSGVKAQKSQHVDLTEVLKRISEMQRPPGKNVEVTLQMELEHFFYGVHKVIPRNRRVKDFYAGMVTQEHLYRLHVERGAAEPVEISFKVTGRSSWGGDHGHGFRSKEITMLMLALTL